MNGEAGRCGYSKCRAELPGPGMQGGRPRSFCRDTRWEGGRTCAQLARAEREALGALGLDAGSATFRLDADRLREQLDDVRGPVEALTEALAAVTTRLDEVEAAAVASVEAAHAQVAEAERARLAAEEAREQAEHRMRQSTISAERAANERAEAVERASAATRQAMEATEALGAARQQAEEATTSRRTAEAQAAREAERAAGTDRQLREIAVLAERAIVERDAARAAEADRRVESESLRADLAAERAHLRDAEAALTTAEQSTARAEADCAAAEGAGLRAVADAERALADLRIQSDHDAKQARAERAVLTTQLTEQKRLAQEQALQARTEIETLRADPARGKAPRLHPDDLQAVIAALTPADQPARPLLT